MTLPLPSSPQWPPTTAVTGTGYSLARESAWVCVVLGVIGLVVLVRFDGPPPCGVLDVPLDGRREAVDELPAGLPTNAEELCGVDAVAAVVRRAVNDIVDHALWLAQKRKDV